MQTGVPWLPTIGDSSVYLPGTATQLQPGDAILIVGDERLQVRPAATDWDVRHRQRGAARQRINLRTLVTWIGGLGRAPASSRRKHNPEFYALRQRAALFGDNAINPLMLAARTRSTLETAGLISSSTGLGLRHRHRPGNQLSDQSLVDLDAVYSKLVPGGWLA